MWLLLDLLWKISLNVLQSCYVIFDPFQTLSHGPFWVVYWCWTLCTGPQGLRGTANQSFALHCKRTASKWIHLFIQLVSGCEIKININKQDKTDRESYFLWKNWWGVVFFVTQEEELDSLRESIEAVDQNRPPLKVINGYSILDHLGTGAFGSVFKVKKKCGIGLDQFCFLVTSCFR